MPRFGITGHVNLTDASVPLVYDAIVSSLLMHAGSEVTGVSCIAWGADAIFARAILDLGGRLEVVIPAADYRSKLDAAYAAVYDEFVDRAVRVHKLPFRQSDRAAYEAANQVMVDADLDELLAVWDGHSNGVRADTASVVRYARDQHVPVTVLWPAGAARTAR